MWSLKCSRAPPKKRRYRYIVVGAGSAGALVANRLASSAEQHSVLLLEAGGGNSRFSFLNPIVHVPAGYLLANGNPRLDWCLRTERDPGIDNRALKYPRGKILGGCSAINGQIYNRGQRRDYTLWAERSGSAEWSWENCLPHFKKHERHWRGESEHHGGAGEFPVAQHTFTYPILEAIREAFQQAGVPPTQDFNCGDNLGVSYFELNQWSGLRATTASAFLPQVINKSNFEVIVGANVGKLKFCDDGGSSLSKQTRCTGVFGKISSSNKSVVDFEADLEPGGEVILCAGALHTPALLQVSGIGDKTHLQQTLGVDVVQSLPGVGQAMEDHLQIRTVFKLKCTPPRLAAYPGGPMTLNRISRSPIGVARIGLQYLLKRSGPLSMAPSQLGVFLRSSGSEPHPNIQFHCQPCSLDAFGEPLHSFEGITLSVCNLNPTSTGSCNATRRDLLASGGPPETALRIVTNYLSTERDKKVAIESVAAARRVMEQTALAEVEPEEVFPGRKHNDQDSPLSFEEEARAAGRIATTIFHPTCTAKMGKPEDDMSVVDAELRVKNVRGLRIADCSVMPNITSGNTAAPVMMIGEKCAEWVLRDGRKQ